MKKILTSIVVLILFALFVNAQTYLGTNAGASVTTGTYNTLLGYYAGYSITSGSYNTVSGADALRNLATESVNDAYGYQAGYNMTSGTENTFFGSQSGFYKTAGTGNTFVGHGAGSGLSGGTNTGSNNVCVGRDAGLELGSGNNNILIGQESGVNTASGLRNVFVGTKASYSNTSGSDNVSVGYKAGYSNTGSSNVSIGYQAGYSNIGSSNVFIGYQTGYNETGSNTLYIDNSNTSNPLIYGEFDNDYIQINGDLGIGTIPSYKLHITDEGTTTFSKAIGDETINIGIWGDAEGDDLSGEVTQGVYGQGSEGYLNYGLMGYGIKSSSTNAGYNFGVYGHANNTYGTDYAIYGNTGTDASDWAGYFVGKTHCTSGAWYSSDRKFKKDIQDIDNALSLITKLQPRSYYFKQDEYKYMSFQTELAYGFIAQELEEVFPNLVTDVDQAPIYDQNGKLVTEAISFKAVNYNALIPVLTEAIKEQQQIIEEQEQINTEQQQQIEALQAEIDALKIQTVSPSDQSDLQSSSTKISTENFDLFQNEPNPFENITSITYYLGEESSDAYIGLYNLNGSLINQYPVEQSGYGQVEINASDLAAGIYLYSLIINGQEIKTLRMVISR